MMPGEGSNGKIVMMAASITLLAASVLLAGCLNTGPDDDLDLVIVSIAPQRELVERIAGDDIDVEVMVPLNMDPHSYSPTPSQLIKVSKADIYFMMGSGIEFEELNMDTIREVNSGMDVVDLSDGIEVVSFEDHGIDHDHDDGEDGEDHQGTDPHVWLDPNNMLEMADTVLDALISADPSGEGTYRENHQVYVAELGRMIDDIMEVLGPFKNETFLTYHPAWGYFADTFHLIQLSVEDDGKEPGPQGIAALISQARENDIRVVFVEPQFDTSSAEEIADAIGGSVVTVDPLSSDYIGNLMEVAEKMVEGFNT